MNKLSYKTLTETGFGGYLLREAPERVLQFGEGNFLRAFVDYFIDILNEKAGFNGKVCLVQPIPGGDFIRDAINAQEGLYTLYLRGFENGGAVNRKRVISSVSRCINPYVDNAAFLDNAKNPDLRFIVSNTTEAGIAYDSSCKFDDAPANSFPAKMTRFLYERFKFFGKEKGKGFIILSCELIDNNGRELKRCVKLHATDWNLGEEFSRWIDEENIFCSTLVDRIVTGYPRDEANCLNEENGYEDNVIDTGECFGFWVIEGPKSIADELGLAKTDLPIIVVDDHTPYKQRKVRILNGAHTSFVLGAYLKGFNIVRDCMNDEGVRSFMEETIYAEIIPTLTLPEKELKDFATSVTERFKNPFINHKLLDISLNSVSKWKARCLPSVKAYYEKFGKSPKNLSASFRSLVEFYSRGEKWNAERTALEAKRGDETYLIRDDKKVLEWFFENRTMPLESLVTKCAANVEFWGEDINIYL
ncbi:MAG: tagaturonate reductase [Kiritimatiellae bacterium]|nr:tagaturonate reductase [Kiritimatiellia bacterium]